MNRLAGLFVAMAILLGAHAASADTAAYVYTIGPGAYLYARYGHSLLCIVEDEKPESSCYDFGVAAPGHEEAMMWESFRGAPIFIAAKVPLGVVVSTFRDQDRTIERQRLPLSDEELAKMRAYLDGYVERGTMYAYHPAFANCSTKVRDAIDAATDEKLRKADTHADGPSIRALSEEGLSGHPLELMVVALTYGPALERPPTRWESGFLPQKLKESIEGTFGAKPEMVYEHVAATVPTSTQLGRVLLLLIGIGLAFWIRRASRNSQSARARTRALRVAGIVLALLAVIADFVAALCAYPEVRSNWALVIFWPSDAALGFMSSRVRTTYVTLRIAVVTLVGLSELVGFTQQLVMPLALTVVFVLVAIYRTEPKTARAPNPERRAAQPSA